MPKGFSEVEKHNISENLFNECRKQWELHGYRKTSVDILCANTGISKGGFYLFFDTKEDLFIKTLSRIQIELYEEMNLIIDKNQSKQGFCEAMILLYKEYDRSSFLYNTSSLDSISLFNKITNEQKHLIKSESFIGAKKLLNYEFIKLKVSEEMAISVLSTLLYTINGKDELLSNHFEVFEFMLVSMIDEIFE